LFPEIQSTLCYERKLSRRFSLYSGLTYLDAVKIVNENTPREELGVFLWSNKKNNYVGFFSSVFGVKRIYNTSFLNNLGYVFGSKYQLTKKPAKKIRFYLDANVGYLRYLMAKGWQNNLKNVCTVQMASFNFGTTMNLRIYKSLYYYQSISLGLALIVEDFDDPDYPSDDSSVEPYYNILNLGLGYNF
jgi:hypothetical protein